MPRGAPDWAQNQAFADVEQGVDVQELSARASQRYMWGRSGKVIFIDDFSPDIGRWNLVFEPGTSNITSTSGGVFSDKVMAMNLAVVSTAETKAYLSLPLFRAEKYLLQQVFSISSNAGYGGGYIEIHKAGKIYRAEWRMNTNASALQLLQANGSFLNVISPLTILMANKAWHFIQLGIDVSTGKYTSLQFDAKVPSLGDMNLYTGTGGAEEYIEIGCTFRNLTGAPLTVWWASVILATLE
jgi:hypothetical protein